VWADLGVRLHKRACTFLRVGPGSGPSRRLSFTPRNDALSLAGHLTMRKTLRRSCDACSKSKLRCDLRTPRCSRCSKKAITCAYANEPLSSLLTEITVTFSSDSPIQSKSPDIKAFTPSETLYLDPGIQAFDPFDSYPQTRLPRAKVQQLIQHCESLPNTAPLLSITD
jgi:hypothetical protein